MSVVTPVDNNGQPFFTPENPAHVVGSSDGSLTQPLPSGTNTIGKVDVNSLPPIPSGSNTIGKVDVNSLPSLPTGSNTLGNVGINQEKFVEQKSQVDAVTGTVTFSAPVTILQIINTDGTNDGVFTVNGLTIIVPKNSSFKAAFGGTQSASVTITGSTLYLLNRFA